MRIIFGIILLDILFFYTSLYDFQMLQQNGYNNKYRYTKFLFKNIRNSWFTFLIEVILGIFLLSYTLISNYIYLDFILISVLLIYLAIINYKKHSQKLPLKFTKRLIRILAFDYLIFLLLFLTVISFYETYFYGIMLLFICLNPIFLHIIVYLLEPVEKAIFNHYKNAALTKLARMNDLKIIGITGSFGKTSTKMILNSILSSKLKGFYTPGSYNTPNGNIITINNEETIFNDYFISEMGAKARGEIKEICDLVHPKYAILTSIGNAHIETFKSIENITKTKFELVESLPKDGVCILNRDDKYQTSYELHNKCHVIWVGIDKKADIMAQNIKMTSKGTSFEVIFKDEKKPLKLKTVLLGKKNVYNILSCVALAKQLGLNYSEIAKGVSNIKSIEHRLEIKEFGNVTVIDDAYNSNPEGAKNALEVLSLLEGRKVIITPGMIELGNKQELENKNFGKEIADVCDRVYLIGERQTKPIYDGLILKRFNKNNIKVYNNFKKAYEDCLKLNEGKKTVILIENDLPDSYTEA